MGHQFCTITSRATVARENVQLLNKCQTHQGTTALEDP
ncbi:hypothetical protein HU200_013273 [Digitaria exilis]|uniref:Uncharacterized protein n=1 Tax=Digitaria exilis TaxID=1010633 RepID=A0A835FDI1_9POAL|nr:hypothetical protein HU200_013273 [Digitaria exilis]